MSSRPCALQKINLIEIVTEMAKIKCDVDDCEYGMEIVRIWKKQLFQAEENVVG